MGWPAAHWLSTSHNCPQPCLSRLSSVPTLLQLKSTGDSENECRGIVLLLKCVFTIGVSYRQEVARYAQMNKHRGDL